MPKKVFWPATLVVMGLIFLASNLGYLPSMFWNFWPIILIIVGLGGLLVSDRDEWLIEPTTKSKSTKKTTKKATKKKAAPKTKKKTTKKSKKK